MIVVLAPGLDHDLGLTSIDKPLPVQALVTQFTVEAFYKAILPWTAWLDEVRPHMTVAQPFDYGIGRKFTAII